MGIGRHYIAWRYITSKLYIVHHGYGIEVIVKYCDNSLHPKPSKIQPVKNVSNNDVDICEYFFFINYMPMGIGRHYIIRRYYYQIIHIGMHNGYVVVVIVKYCANTWNIELDRAGQKCAKQRYFD